MTTTRVCKVVGCADPDCQGAEAKDHVECGNCGRKFSSPAPSALCVFCHGGVEPLPMNLDCGHVESDHLPVTRGYGRDVDGRTWCYDCCTAQDLETIRGAKPGDRCNVGLYLSCDGTKVTNWPGRTLMGRVWIGRLHPWSRERHYVSAIDELGRTWSGTAAPGMWASLRLTKS